MRLYVIHQSDGAIIAAAVEPEAGTNGLFARPFAISPDHYEADVDVPEEHQQIPLEEICCRFDVDPAGPRLVARSQPRAVNSIQPGGIHDR